MTEPEHSHFISHRWLAAGLTIAGIGAAWQQLWPVTYALHGDLVYPSAVWWCLVKWWGRRGFVTGWKAHAAMINPASKEDR